MGSCVCPISTKTWNVTLIQFLSRENIKATLAAGTSIVIDRYYYSGIVYSAAKDNPSLSLEWARCPEVGLPRPDICIFLKLSTDGAAQRAGFGQEKYEKREMQDRVRDLFDDLTLQRQPEASDTEVIDASTSMDEVESQVLQKVGRIVEEVSNGIYGKEVRRIEPWA